MNLANSIQLEVVRSGALVDSDSSLRDVHGAIIFYGARDRLLNVSWSTHG